MQRRDALTETFLQTLPLDLEPLAHHQQAVEDVAKDVLTIEKNDPDYARARVLARLALADHVHRFRITWLDGSGTVRINTGWRVQNSNLLGPYKGGLRFHPSVNADILQFLAFEQSFKNALTGLPLGGAKGGSDFDPKGCSPEDIMRFCQAFMGKLAPLIGPDQDVPAGDINVGAREIGWLFGAWRTHAGQYGGALTGKGLSYGGAELRAEATGYGLIYFVMAMLEQQGKTLEGQRIAISGMGNVALHAAEKARAEGGCVIALSDSSGRLYAADGFSAEALEWVAARKGAGAEISAPPAALNLRFDAGEHPWDLGADIALPCATQNELDADMAQALIDGGVCLVAEGANMPLTAKATQRLQSAGIVHAPGKAANAGGVAVSGLEMSQNSQRRPMSRDAVDAALRDVMRAIHDKIAREGFRSGGHIDYRRGANVAAYRRLADAMTAQGAV